MEYRAHGARRGLAVVERRRDRRVVVLHALIEFLVVLGHSHRVVLQLLNMIEDGIDNVIDFGQGAGAAALREQSF